MNKRRYEYCSETQMIFDNMLGDYVEDVVERLNTQDRNKDDLYKQYQLREDEIRQLKKALELACEDCPIKCPDVPERYNLQDEYGSDEPYWVEEGGCEFGSPANCMECTMNFYKQRAKELLKNEENC